MTFQKIISLVQVPIGGDVLAERKALGPSDVRDVINVDSIFVEEKSVQLPPIHPRPTLPSRVAIIGNYLPQEVWNRDVHNGSVRCHSRRIWCDRTPSLAGE